MSVSLLGRLKAGVLGLPRAEADFSRRGFPGIASPSREHLEKVLHSFIDGYNLAVVEPDMAELARRLDGGFSPEFCGFAYEGAGLYFALLDLLLGANKL